MSALHLVCHPPGQCWRLGWQTVARGDTLPCSESSALARLSSLPCLRHSLTEILPQQHSIWACPHPASLAMPISLFFSPPRMGLSCGLPQLFLFFFRGTSSLFVSTFHKQLGKAFLTKSPVSYLSILKILKRRQELSPWLFSTWRLYTQLKHAQK